MRVVEAFARVSVRSCINVKLESSDDDDVVLRAKLVCAPQVFFYVCLWLYVVPTSAAPRLLARRINTYGAVPFIYMLYKHAPMRALW